MHPYELVGLRRILPISHEDIVIFLLSNAGNRRTRSIYLLCETVGLFLQLKCTHIQLCITYIHYTQLVNLPYLGTWLENVNEHFYVEKHSSCYAFL